MKILYQKVSYNACSDLFCQFYLRTGFFNTELDQYS